MYFILRTMQFTIPSMPCWKKLLWFPHFQLLCHKQKRIYFYTKTYLNLFWPLHDNFLVLSMQYSLANSREERRNLYLVLFDYVLHQINETCIATSVSEYTDDEIQPLATLLTLADAPKAFYISVKLGVEGIGEILKRSISTALTRYPNSERLNVVMLQMCLNMCTCVCVHVFCDLLGR